MTMTLAPCDLLKQLPDYETRHVVDLDKNVLTVSTFFRAKEFLDGVVAFLLLIPALPMMAFLVVLVRLNSPGPGIFCQTRVGKNGRIFTMYKIRTMRSDAEQRTGPVWAPIAGDPRVTRLGYWLRRLHLDELPQLFNVILGHMSLVGPRPERPAFVEVLAEQIPGYASRILVRPGVTGLAQVNLPPDSDLDSVRRKLTLDREYITSASLGLDVRIVACTVLRVFGLRNGMSVRLFGLARTVELSTSAPRSSIPPVALLTPEGISKFHVEQELKPSEISVAWELSG